MRYGLLFVALAACLMAGCNSGTTPSTTGATDAGGGDATAGSFTLTWSEYPSWSVYGVAEEMGLIDAAEGKQGTLEEKWKVDVVLKQLDYDGCLAAYGNSTCDAVCITNMDILAPAIARGSVAILPTSTSAGADACIVTGIDSVEGLKGKDSYGLEKSVSQYMFERALEELGQNPADFPFKQMDPGMAAQAMQTNQENISSIVVWNPFVIQTLRARGDDAKVLFDSTKIPEEIVDMVVVGQDSLDKPGGKAFAACITEAFYAVNKAIADAATSDDTLVTLGKKFGDLELADMKIIVEQTKFYATPADGSALFERADFQSTIMPRVVDFCASHDIIDAKPTISYGADDAQLKFDTSFMKQVAN